MALSVYLDANVLVSAFVTDVFSERADRFLKSPATDLVVSDFVRAEFASVMGRLFRTKQLTKADVEGIFSAFDTWVSRKMLFVEIQSADVRAAEGLLRDLRLGLRAPDAVNIAIAQRLGAELATFDKQMAAAARTLGISVVLA